MLSLRHGSVAPKYETSSDLVTNKKVAQSKQKKGKGTK